MSAASETLMYARLAAISHAKGQLGGRDHLLVLAAVAACRDGDLETAATCRGLVLAHNPQHMLGKWANVAEALRDADFDPFVKKTARLCHPEQGEAMLANARSEWPELFDATGEAALRVALDSMCGCGGES